MVPPNQFTVPALVRTFSKYIVPLPLKFSTPLLATVRGQAAEPPVKLKLLKTVKLPLPLRVPELRFRKAILVLLVRVAVPPLVKFAVS